MDIKNIQQQLPAGLQVDAVLQQSAVFGDLFRLFDRRLDEQAPLERRLRVFEFGDVAWRAALIKQVRGLCGINSPRLLRPLEAGVLTSGAIYLIEDVLPTSVENQLPPDGKSLPAGTAWPWIEQILDGLEELHAAGLSHGTWRLDSLLLDTNPVDANTKAVLGDAVGGVVPLISQGGILVDGVSDYFPPEWNGVLKPPSPQADVYALGLLACEMLLGRAVVRNVKAQQIAPARVRELLLAKVGNKGLSRSRCEVLRRMLEPNPKLRPAHARAVRDGRKPFLRLVPALAVTAGVLFISTSFWFVRYPTC